MIAIADLSGELNGAKLVTKWFLREIESSGIPATVFDSLPKRKKGYRTLRMILGLRAVVFLVVQRLRSEKNLYLPLAGGKYLAIQLLYVETAKLLGYRIYLHHHSYSYIVKKSAISRKFFCFNSSNLVHIFLTNKMQSDFENVYGTVQSCWTLTNATAVQSFKRDSLIPDDSALKERVKLVHYGKLSSAKGSDVVLELYSKLLKADLRVSCLVVGVVDDNVVKDIILELKKDFPDNFTHLENYVNSELHQILFDCDYFLFPSKYVNEAAPLVVYEAQFNGLVCYTSKAGSLESIVVTPGETIKIEDWLSSITERIETESMTLSDMHPENRLLNRERVRLAMETEALQGRIMLQGLISQMRESEPRTLV